METHGVIETFVDHDDAIRFFEMTLFEYAASGWQTVQGSGIQFVNHQWRVGFQFEKERNRAE